MRETPLPPLPGWKRDTRGSRSLPTTTQRQPSGVVRTQTFALARDSILHRKAPPTTQPRDGPRVPFALASEVASHLDQELLTLLGNTYETLARDFHELPIYWTKFI